MSSDPKPPAPFPPLAISDLVVLTLCVGFAMACVAPEFHEAIKAARSDWQSLTADVIDYFVIGLALFGLIVLARQRIRGAVWELSPGHWILMAAGLYVVTLLAATLLRPIAVAYVFGNTRVFRAFDNLLFALVIGLSIGWSIPGVRVLPWRWRLCLSAILIWLSLCALYVTLEAAYELGAIRFRGATRRHFTGVMFSMSLLGGCLAIVAAAIDAVTRVRRDWLHYFAVVAVVLNSISHALTWGEKVAQWWWNLYLRVIP